MSKVVLDAATLAKLNGLKTDLELYDESGRLVGVCCSTVKSPTIGMSEAELDAAFAQTKRGRKWADIRRDMLESQ